MRLSGRAVVVFFTAMVCVLVAACADSSATVGTASSDITDVVTDTSFMADIVSNVLGGRLTVSSLMPEGADPHSFEPTPKDARRLAESRAVVINVTGLVPTIDGLLDGVVGPDVMVIEAAAGIPGVEIDPHCWLDPVLVLQYVDNIVAALTALDPAGSETYVAEAARYQGELRALDTWIKEQVATIPPENRLLVTDHETLGRFAERYGFTVVGAIFPTATGEGSPSARGLTELVKTVEETGAPAIFLESGANSDVADQLAEVSGAKVITDLYTHTLGPGAPTYIDMMRWDVTKIVEALR